MRQPLYNLRRVLPLRAETLLSDGHRLKHFHQRVKPVPPGGDQAEPVLFGTAQINTHDPAIFHILHKPPYTVGKIVFINPAGS